MSNKLWAWVGGAVVGLGIAYGIAGIVDITGQDKFCVNCHEMEPMGKTFQISVHGGNNPHGFKAHHCTDCHVSHTSIAAYLVTKGMSATKDALAKIGVIKKVDFVENINEMDKYVYDSGCLHCHAKVEDPESAYGMSEASRFAHTQYWKDKKAGKDVSCVKCHNDISMPNFAHPNLIDAIKKHEEEKK